MSTERLDDNSTQRLDDTSTQRLSDNSTQRLNDGSTQRLDDSGAAQESEQTPSSLTKAALVKSKMALQDTADSGINQGDVFAVGQVVELNGKRYFIEEIISDNSGEAVIYKVSQEGNNYVLKYYKPGLELPAAVISKIKDNPTSRIVRVYDFGRHLEQNFEIMEYAQGGSLADYIKENGAIKDAAKLKSIIGQIAEGLEQLHGVLRIIYQDLKPENIYFKDAGRNTIILGDFGISNVMFPGKNEAEVRASVTKEYASPELARTGNNLLVIVDPSIDYFALGITMLYLWLGVKPFQGVNESVRARQILTKDVTFPQDMHSDYKILIQGLIDPLVTSRWGSAQINKWIAGESLVSDYQKTMLKYRTVPFSDSESFSSPEELADLLEKYPDRGIRFLYKGDNDKSVIVKWLEDAQDEYNLSKIKDILKIADEEHEKKTGVFAAVYALNPDKPFVSHGNRKCYNCSEIASALMDESEYYMDKLTNNEDFFYLYLLSTEGANGPIIAQKFHKYFVEFSPRRALSLIYLKLQDDDGRSITIGSKTYYSLDEAAAEQDSSQINLLKQAIMEKDSLFNVWLSDNSGGFLETADGFHESSTKDRFYLLGKFPFLSYKELVPGWNTSALIDLQILSHQCPGRFDLFDTYAKQGLPFTGQAENLDWRPGILSFLANFFNDIAADDKTKLELVKLLKKHGADLNEYSGDGSLPLTTAIFKRNVPLVKLLLELGADPNKEEKYQPLFWALCQNADGEDEEIRFELVNLLLDHNADVNIGRGDLTFLTLVILMDSPQKVPCVKRLLSAGVNVNKACNDGITPLMNSIVKYGKYTDSSSKKNELEIIRLLLSKKAKTEVLNKKGYWSPLMRAADSDSPDVINLLLQFGARKDFADADNDIAYVYAVKKNNKNIKDILRPGIELTGIAALISIAKFILASMSALWVFISMDILARAISSANFSFPALVVVTAIASHLLTAYIMIAFQGLRSYLIDLKYTFSSDEIEKAFFFVIGVPIIFPLAIAFLQFLIRLLPVEVNEMLLRPMNLFASSTSGFGTFLLYLLSMAIMIGALIFFHRITFKFKMKKNVYDQYK